MSVRAVFDTSALLGYANVDQAIPVAEFVLMINEENHAIGDDPNDVEAFAETSQIGIPTSAFLHAYTQTDSFGRSLLADLAADLAVAEELSDTRRSTFVFLPLATVSDVLEASELERRCPGQGEAVHHAVQHNAILATYQPPREVPAAVRLTDLSAGWDDYPSSG